MKKIFLILVVIISFISLYFWRLKNSFKYEIISLDNVYEYNNNYYLDFSLKVSNPLSPDIKIEKIFLDVWINGEYFGNTYNDKTFNVINGEVIIPLTIKSGDPALSIALMIEEQKNIQAKGFVKTSLIKIPIYFENKF